MGGPVLPSSTVFPRADLMGHLRGHSRRFDGFVAARILPPILSEKDEGSFLKIPAAASLRRYKTVRAEGGGYQRRTFTASTGTFKTEERGLESPISHRKRIKYANNIALDQFEAIETARGVLREYEADVLDTVINETNFPASGTTGVTLSVPWDAAAATPAAEVDTGAAAIKAKTGVTKDQMVLAMSDYTFRKLSGVTDVYTRLKVDAASFGYTLTKAQLALYFGVKDIVVGSAQYNSADDGQTASIASMFNEDYAFLFVPPESESPESPQLGRTVIWTGDLESDIAEVLDASIAADMAAGGSPLLPMVLEMYTEPNLRQDVLRVRSETDEVLFNSDCGYLFKNCKT